MIFKIEQNKILFLFQFEKKALADALSLYMRAIMALDEITRSKIVHPNATDENFDHLKIECRARDKQEQHVPFGEQLFNIMKSVKRIE
jgi:hypothetical protein